MPDPVSQAAGFWWRFSRYEVRDGFIRPAAHARLKRYNPWDEYLSTRANGDEPPYQSLLALLRDIDAGSGSSHRAEPGSSNRAVATWCTKHGLLGILLHRAHLVTLAPRWALEPGLGPTLVPVQVQHLRTNYPWSPLVTREVAWPLQVSFDPAQVGTLVSPERLPTDYPRPSVALRDLARPGWHLEPLAKTWAGFFPDVPRDDRETYAYPDPLSDDFWQLYAEPVDEFLDAATAFAKVVRDFAQDRAAGSTQPQGDLLASHETLHSLIAPVSPALVTSRTAAVERRWLAPSLLGLFAMMAVEDLAEGRMLRYCSTCSRPFVSRAYQARYCSERCQKTAQNARLSKAASTAIPNEHATLTKSEGFAIRAEEEGASIKIALDVIQSLATCGDPRCHHYPYAPPVRIMVTTPVMLHLEIVDVVIPECDDRPAQITIAPSSFHGERVLQIWRAMSSGAGSASHADASFRVLAFRERGRIFW